MATRVAQVEVEVTLRFYKEIPEGESYKGDDFYDDEVSDAVEKAVRKLEANDYVCDDWRSRVDTVEGYSVEWGLA